jgi:TolA-binding protein
MMNFVVTFLGWAATLAKKGKWEQVRGALHAALESLDSLEQAVTRLSGWREEDQQLLRKQRQQLEAMADAIQYFQIRKEEEQQKRATRGINIR